MGLWNKLKEDFKKGVEESKKNIQEHKEKLNKTIEEQKKFIEQSQQKMKQSMEDHKRNISESYGKVVDKKQEVDETQKDTLNTSNERANQNEHSEAQSVSSSIVNSDSFRITQNRDGSFNFGKNLCKTLDFDNNYSNQNDKFSGRGKNHYIFQNSLKLMLERDFSECPVLGWLFHPDVEFYAHHIGINIDTKSSQFNISKFVFIGEWKSGLYVGYRDDDGSAISNINDFLNQKLSLDVNSISSSSYNRGELGEYKSTFSGGQFIGSFNGFNNFQWQLKPQDFLFGVIDRYYFFNEEKDRVFKDRNDEPWENPNAILNLEIVNHRNQELPTEFNIIQLPVRISIFIKNSLE